MINISARGKLFTPKIAKAIIDSPGEVLELADRRDLGSRAVRREGSTPSFPTLAAVNLLQFTYPLPNPLSILFNSDGKERRRR